jgi:hypothetical protein
MMPPSVRGRISAVCAGFGWFLHWKKKKGSPYVTQGEYSFNALNQHNILNGRAGIVLAMRGHDENSA